MVKNELKSVETVPDCDRIKGFGFPSFVYPLMMSCLLGMASNIIFNISKNDSYISVLIGSIIGIIPLMLVIYIVKNNDGDGIINLNIRLFGKVLGTIFNYILSIFSILFISLLFYNLSLFLDIQYIPDTNPLYVKILIMIPIVYASSKNIAVLSRLSQMLLVAALVIFFVSAFGVLPDFDVENLEPVLADGIENPLKAGIMYTIFSVLPLFFLIVIPTKFQENKRNNTRNIVIMYIISNLVIFCIFLITTAVLGYELVSVYKYPEYMILKRISVLSVIERIENTLAIQFLFNMIMCIILLFYFVIRNIKNTIKSVKTQQLLPYLLGTLVITIAYNMFPNSLYGEAFTQKYVPYALGIFLMGGLILISIAIFMKNRKERNKKREI